MFSLNSINRTFFAAEKQCARCEVRPEFLNTDLEEISVIKGLKTSNILEREMVTIWFHYLFE
jgi:hypothetical protein